MSGAALPFVGHYDYWLVALSVFIAILASYAALDLAGRVASARGWTGLCWLGGGAAALGTGIWTVNYIGMEAHRLPVPVYYDWPTMLLSFLAAVAASVVALYVASRETMGKIAWLGGAIAAGYGIAATHSLGMEAMRLPATFRYSSSLVTLSVVAAVAVTGLALFLTYQFRGDASLLDWRKCASAAIVGLALSVAHYTGMAAVSFIPAILKDDVLGNAVSITALGIAAIAIIAAIVLLLVIVLARADRLFWAERRVAGSIPGEHSRECLFQGSEEPVCAHQREDGETSRAHRRFATGGKDRRGLLQLRSMQSQALADEQQIILTGSRCWEKRKRRPGKTVAGHGLSPTRCL